MVRVVTLASSLALAAFLASAGAPQAAAGHFPGIEWVSVLGSGTARDLRQAADGGYFLTGWTEGQPGAGSAIFLIRTDRRGARTWERLLPGNGYSCGFGITLTGDGSAVVVGDTKAKTGDDHDLFVAKVDADGNVIWEQNFGGPRCDYGAAVLQTEDGGYLVAGGTESSGAGIYDVYLVRLDDRGRLIWERTYGGKGSDCGYALLPTADGTYVIAGNTESTDSGRTSAYLIKVDAGGGLLWERTYGGECDSYGWSLLQAGDGGYLVAGEIMVTGAAGGGFKTYMVKTDAQGREIWERIYGGDSYGTGYAVWQAGGGGYLLAGKQEAAGGVHYPGITWTDGRGGPELGQTSAGLGAGCIYAGRTTGDGGSIMAGEQGLASGGEQKVLLVKLAPDRGDALTVQVIVVLAAAIALAGLACFRGRKPEA